MILHIKLSAEMNPSAAAKHTRDEIVILLFDRAKGKRDLAQVAGKSGTPLWIEQARALEHLAYELETMTID